jgi:hypothetical protein
MGMGTRSAGLSWQLVLSLPLVKVLLLLSPLAGPAGSQWSWQFPGIRPTIDQEKESGWSCLHCFIWTQKRTCSVTYYDSKTHVVLSEQLNTTPYQCWTSLWEPLAMDWALCTRCQQTRPNHAKCHKIELKLYGRRSIPQYTDFSWKELIHPNQLENQSLS